ncbi:hypothetical protein KXW19_006654 [Aspergillus fumigatus]|nr:hypothetical protein KXX30_008653 [Aspergillus fumigatus]KAH1375669.1 hypothetical protein KXX50_000975 [Aspergillus fumigatus]KAH1954218.1 hypothetical protein KXV59_003677 [Aspergillus fumigatus]KAH1976026.1 hypothetical protein KXX04_002858 [Aspergillus fumigatus]KAH3526930.1 hypothetical protein KXV93_009064 [Aspergillus fumigatus]
MAVTDQPAGLMDIASSLTQDEIPFKLRCASCNKLAVNAFRLPCCDQAICENCQISLPETCPVCAHTPISPDLCKPNKALRTTLKAFLRTEEKKREKERQSATPAISNGVTPADVTPAQSETPVASEAPASNTVAEIPEGKLHSSDVAGDESSTVVTGAEPSDTVAENVTDTNQAAVPMPSIENDQAENGPAEAGHADEATEENKPAEGHATEEPQIPQPADEGMPQAQGPTPMFPNAMGFNMGPSAFPNMAWNNASGDFNPMAQFMANGMFNFPNPMAMSGMGMDPMAANQGMLGGYGMNMNGMNSGMNMGMNFDASQGMYGGWDGSQNNMWNGGQDKFNPNAFANGMGPQYEGPSEFGGYNMSQPNGVHAQMQQQQFPSQDFQNGYYGPGYGRSNFRGRGRGFVPGGRGRGGFVGHMQANYPSNTNYAAFQTPNSSDFDQDTTGQSQEGGPAGTGISQDDSSATERRSDEAQSASGDGQVKADQAPSNEAVSSQEASEDAAAQATSADRPTADGNTGEEEPQLRGIPTIDSLDQSNHYQMMPNASMGMPGHFGMGYGRGYMRGQFPGGRGGGFGGAPFMGGPNMQQEPRGQGVEGAPAAPRAMREGLPNTSILRQRNYFAQGRPSGASLRSEQSATPTTPHEDARTRTRSKSRSRSRAKSPSRPTSRSRSPGPSDVDGRRSVRQRSPTVDKDADDRERRRDAPRKSRREDKYDEHSAAEDDRRSRSPDRKRSRRDRTQSPADSDYSSRHHSRRIKRDREDGGDRDKDSARDKVSTKTSEPEKDPHTLEREARNRERMLKEQQRREAMNAESKSSRRRDNRQERILTGGRRLSYKYEDEEPDSAHAARVEREREASRWA